MDSANKLVSVIAMVLLFMSSIAGAACLSCETELSGKAVASGSYSGGGIGVEKNSSFETVLLGEEVVIDVYVRNGYSEDKSFEVQEPLSSNVTDWGPFSYEKTTELITGTAYMKARVTVPGNSEAKLSYAIRPAYYGNLRIPPTRIMLPDSEIKSKWLVISVVCNGNGVCETELDENYFTCKADCPLDEEDDLCRDFEDGVCDPDCSEDEDPDCASPSATTARTLQVTTTTISCGNGVCDAGEDYSSCSPDCRSGMKDGVCDQVREGRCDPDCKSGEDSDCGRDVSGGIVILLLFISGIILFIAYKKRWIKLGKE